MIVVSVSVSSSGTSGGGTVVSRQRRIGKGEVNKLKKKDRGKKGAASPATHGAGGVENKDGVFGPGLDREEQDVLLRDSGLDEEAAHLTAAYVRVCAHECA